MGDSLFYKLRSGKPPKLVYFLANFSRLTIPVFFYRGRLKKMLSQLQNHPEKEYISERVNYYNKLSEKKALPNDSIRDRYPSHFIYLGTLKDYKMAFFHTVYFFDSKLFTRWFNPNLRWGYIPGDVYFTPEFPSIVKSRLLAQDNHNSIVMKLDKFRHFIYVNDPVPFAKKKDMAIFRGKIRASRDRRRFLELFFNHPMFDCGVVGWDDPDEWKTPKKTIRGHLDYKFIMTLEGNDVASNLKWAMSSNSIAVMPKPTCETWFMEGKLIPDYHYIGVKANFSDMEEKLKYYIDNPEKAEQIIDNAHKYVAQFRNSKRENLISLLVANKYFEMTMQKDQ